ncbi:putative sodium-dependent excitatory amino acid transporter glt-4 [Ornithodoros turicata]|uniref:putative sodium-dependent excitatory amino acid transporter glt-4 n=1 Tax=Ornithodoros turicata TaxID=34597 RepID=UPI00313A3F32
MKKRTKRRSSSSIQALKKQPAAPEATELPTDTVINSIGTLRPKNIAATAVPAATVPDTAVPTTTIATTTFPNTTVPTATVPTATLLAKVQAPNTSGASGKVVQEELLAPVVTPAEGVDAGAIPVVPQPGSRLPQLRGCYGASTVACICAGAILAYVIRSRKIEVASQTVVYIRFPGDMFVQVMTMTAPLMQVCVTVLSVAQMGSRLFWRVVAYAAMYALLTCLAAQTVAVLIVSTVTSGHEIFNIVGPIPPSNDTRGSTFVNVVEEFIRAMVPGGIVDAFVFKRQSLPTDDDFEDFTQDSRTLQDVLSQQTNFGTNGFGLMTMSMFLGLALSNSDDADSIVLDCIGGVVEVLFRFTQILAWICPPGIGFLVMNWLLSLPDIADTTQALGSFLTTVLLSCFLQGVLVQTVLYIIFVKGKHKNFAFQIAYPVIMAGGGLSSMAIMPTSIMSLESGFNKQLVRVIVPMLAVVRKDATCIAMMCMILCVARSQQVDIDAKMWMCIVLVVSVSSFMVIDVHKDAPVHLNPIMLSAIGLADAPLPFVQALKLVAPVVNMLNILGDVVAVALVQSILVHALEPLSAPKQTTTSVDAAYIYRTRLKQP